MSTLRQRLLRLAQAEQSLRTALVPLLKSAGLSWSKQPITVATWESTVEVPAVVAGSWAVHKSISGRGWSVTHVPSQKAVGHMSTGKAGKAAVEQIVDTEPSLANASESDLRKHVNMIQAVMTGELPFKSLLTEAGLTNLGERYGKHGDHWGTRDGSSMLIRVGNRDVVLSYASASPYGHKIVVTWAAADMVSRKKMTRAKLLNWVAQVKGAPTTQELRDDARR